MATEITPQLYTHLPLHPIRPEAPHERDAGLTHLPPLPVDLVKSTGPEVPRPEVERLVRDLAEMTQTMNRRLQYVIDDTQQVIVKVIDGTSDKVIKEFPPKELQDLHRRMKEAIGLLFDKVV